MGQRLNIEILKNKEVIANAYYHWSAYTYDALDTLKRALNFYNEHSFDSRYESDKLLLAINMLEATGAGVNEVEAERISHCPDIYKKYEFKPSIDRNEGLLSVTDEGKAETAYWAEGTVSIDLDTEHVYFDVIFREDETDEEGLPQILCEDDFDITCFSFADIGYAMQLVDNSMYGYRQKNGDIITWVR